MSIRKQYDTDLESLKNSLTEMGRNSADAVENALEALCVADADAAAAIVKEDARINNMERDIEHRCMTLLLRQQPVAGDLRRISTAMKVVTDIERIGDHAADIAEIIPHLVTVRKEGDPAVSQAIAMGKKAHQMILDALDALTAEDENAARRVIAADDAVDYDFNAIKHQLAQEIAEDPGKRPFLPGAEAVFFCKTKTLSGSLRSPAPPKGELLSIYRFVPIKLPLRGSWHAVRRD